MNTYYGIKFEDGTTINVRAETDAMAKHKASQKYKSPIHSVWRVGDDWDENGEPTAKAIVGMMRLYGLKPDDSIQNFLHTITRERAYAEEQLGILAKTLQLDGATWNFVVTEAIRQIHSALSQPEPK